jgi:hypothetical protein
MQSASPERVSPPSLTDVEAGPAERAAALDARDLEPELRGLDRGDVPAGATADDNEVLPRRGGKGPAGKSQHPRC